MYEIVESDKKTIVAIAGANHTFNAKTEDISKLDECITVVCAWLKENL